MPRFRKRLRLIRPAPPRFWRRITRPGSLITSRRIREWSLVLNASGIYWQVCRAGRRQDLYVSPLLEKMALQELITYIQDNAPRPKPAPAWPLHGAWFLAPLYLLPLFWFYRLQHYGFAGLLPAVDWEKCGSLDNLRIFLHQEYWRCATSLALHAGWPHLIGNMFFGSVFLILLARVAGIGRAWLLTFLGGILGNFFSALVYNPGYASIGFSTALFAAVGATGGMLLWRSSNKIFMPIAAALAFLALLGTEGVRTDYIAHICGLAAGCALGLGEGFCAKKHLPELPQWLAAALALALPGLAWMLALQA